MLFNPRWLKRVLDLTLAIAGLLVLSPLLLVLAIAIRFEMGCPVLFRQQRIGLGKTPFVLTKFRTMRAASGADGRPLPDGERLTRFGIWLRKTSLDELPQLWNVIRGDISLVGPRPLPMRYLPYFTELECLRFTVRPGITGWAQVQGRNRLYWDQRFACDAYYVENWSLWLDFKILIVTVLKVFSGQDVSADANLVMPDLDDARQNMVCRSQPRKAEGESIGEPLT